LSRITVRNKQDHHHQKTKTNATRPRPQNDITIATHHQSDYLFIQ